jgi:hypothetical protein
MRGDQLPVHRVAEQAIDVPRDRGGRRQRVAQDRGGRPLRDESAWPPTLPPHHSSKGGLAGCSCTSSPASTEPVRSWAMGDPAGFVRVLDEKHLAIPDRPGNKRFDGQRNILENPHTGLTFLVPGRRRRCASTTTAPGRDRRQPGRERPYAPLLTANGGIASARPSPPTRVAGLRGEPQRLGAGPERRTARCRP